MAESLPYPLIPHLRSALTRLSSHPFPSIASPQSLKKRASVALIIRISPSYIHWPPASAPPAADLTSFFGQTWVQHGQPEVLFIKRAARKGDRWTSHVALPGGKRDPEDADDLAAAVRETWEEVGLDVSPSNPNVLQTGNLPQRVITTQWGKVPLMVLCPYIFLLTSHGTPPLKLQPTEVASCHWVPLVELLNEANRTTWEEDVGNRFANQETGVRRWMVTAMVGKMVFNAVHLRPSESVKCTASPAEGTDDGSRGIASELIRWIPGRLHLKLEPPLLLWGLTLGVMADFLDLLPPHNALRLWSYPTFTPWDVRLVIWAASYRFKKRKILEVQKIQESRTPVEAVELGLEAVPLPPQSELREGGIHGLSTGLDSNDERTRLKSSAVSTMLEGYYDIVRRAVAIALLARTGVLSATIFWLYLRSRRLRSVK